MKRIWTMFYLLIITFLIGCSATNIKEKEKSIIEGEIAIHLDSILTPYINTLRKDTDNQACIAIGITKGDKVIFAKTFGYANVENEIEADLNTVFHIASVSKPFTAVAILKLIQQGKLQLNDPIIKHIPAFKMKGKKYKEITIKQILTHTSGIPRNISSADSESQKVESGAKNENLDNAKNFELDFEPGTKYKYSNSAFDLLGIVISKVSGMPFHEYVTRNVLEPAGMTRTFYKKPIDALPDNWATPYTYGLETQVWSPYPYGEDFFPSSGVVTSVLDMCRWGLLHLGKGEYKHFKMLDQAHYSMLSAPHFDTPWGDKIGLSWYLQSFLDRQNIMHLGNDTGFEAFMCIFPEEDLSLIVMANRDFARTGRIMNAASEILFGESPKEYQVSGKYKFTETFKKEGIEKAALLWNELKLDTTDMYFTKDIDIRTTAAVLEQNKQWKEANAILKYYLTLNDKSSFTWRIYGNTFLNLGDTINARKSYKRALTINPNNEKVKKALNELKVSNLSPN